MARGSSSDDDSASDGASFVVAASASKKRKRDRPDSRSSIESSSARPSKHPKQLVESTRQRDHAQTNGSGTKCVGQARKGGGNNGEQATTTARHVVTLLEDSDDEDQDSDAASLVVAAVPSTSKSPKKAPRQNGHRRPSPSGSEASGSQTSLRTSQSARHTKDSPQKRHSASATHPRVESLTGQDSLDRSQSRRSRQHEAGSSLEERSYTNASASASKTRRVRRSLSPEQVNGASSNAEKRAQKQAAVAKQRQTEAEDRFNEAADASHKWQERAARAETKLAQVDERHAAELARLRRNGTVNGAQVKDLQMSLMDKDRLILKLKAQTDKLILEAREHDKKVRDRHEAEIQRMKATGLSNQKPHHEIEAEKEELRRELKEQHRHEILQLREEMAAHTPTARLAAKEREIERMHTNYQQQIADLNRAVSEGQARLQDLVRRQQLPAFVDTGAGGSHFSQDVQALQSELRMLKKHLQDRMILQEAENDAYQATITKLRESEARIIAKAEKQYQAVESSRANLEQECERLRMRLHTAQEQVTEFTEELKKVRTIRPEYTKLKEENPVLVKDNTELAEARKQLLEENSELRRERHQYVDQLAAVLQSKNALTFEIQELRNYRERHGRSEEDLEADQREIKEERVKSQRDMMKLMKRCHKLQKALNKAQNGGLSEPSKTTFSDSSDESEGDEGDQDMGSLLDSPVKKSPRRAARPLREAPEASSAGRDLRSPTPDEPRPPASALFIELHGSLEAARNESRRTLEKYEDTKPAYFFPPHHRERKADTRVPRHKTRVYMRTECHTPYVPDEAVSDSDDEFLEWESQVYARRQSRNPDRKAAVINVCWHRHILDARGTRVRSHNLEFCTKFVQSFGQLIAQRDAEQALLNHMLSMVKLGQLTSDEGALVMRAYHQAVSSQAI